MPTKAQCGLQRHTGSTLSYWPVALRVGQPRPHLPKQTDAETGRAYTQAEVAATVGVYWATP